MIVALAALKKQVINLDSSIICSGKIEFGDRFYHCWKTKGHGRISLIRAIQESCDVFFYELSQKVGIDYIAKEIADRANDGTDGVYLSWDIDSFDPAYAPGTGEPEPNGLTSREGIRMIRQLSKSFDPDRFAMDLVEITPAYDVSDNSSYNGGITSGLGQRLIIELLAGLSLTKRGLNEGDPVRPKDYRGKGNTYNFGNPRAEIPKRD